MGWILETWDDVTRWKETSANDLRQQEHSQSIHLQAHHDKGYCNAKRKLNLEIDISRITHEFTGDKNESLKDSCENTDDSAHLQ